MKLSLKNIVLKQGEFDLEASIEITHPFTGIFGHSGSGKTTMLDLIAGLRKPQKAYIELDGTVLTDTSENYMVPVPERRIGYVPQDGALFPHMTVMENLQYGYSRAKVAVKPITIEQVLAVIELEGKVDRNVNNLSGGEQRRVAFGRALLAQPKLLLLDEPLSNLDVHLKARLLPFLRKMCEEFHLPLIYVTHDPAELKELCEDVFFFKGGRCIKHGKFEEFFKGETATLYKPLAG